MHCLVQVLTTSCNPTAKQDTWLLAGGIRTSALPAHRCDECCARLDAQAHRHIPHALQRQPRQQGICKEAACQHLQRPSQEMSRRWNVTRPGAVRQESRRCRSDTLVLIMATNALLFQLPSFSHLVQCLAALEAAC